MVLQLRTEWTKIIKQKKSKVLLGLVLGATLILCILNLTVNLNAGFFVFDSVQMPIAMIGLLGGFLLPLVAYMMAADSMSMEVTHKTLKHGFMMPIKRSELFLSKLLALTLYNGIVLLSVMLLTVIINVFTMEVFTFGQLFKTLLAYLITLIPMTLISLWGLLIGQFVSSGLALGLAIIGVLALNVSQLFLPILGAISPIGYMEMFSHYIYGNTTLSVMVSVLLYVASYYIMLIAFNILSLNQKEV